MHFKHRLPALLNQLFVTAVMGACFTSIIAAAHSSWRGMLLVADLLLPFGCFWAVVAMAMLWLFRWLERWPGATATALLLTQLGLATLCGGIYLTNLVIVDSPWGQLSRMCYTVTALAAVAVMWWGLSLVPRVRDQILHRGLSEVLGFFLLADGLMAGLLDSYGIRPEYRVHEPLLRLTLAGLSGGSFYVVRARTSWRTTVACAAGLALCLAVLASDRTTIYRELAGTPGAHGRVLQAVRTLTDQDGDGFSPWFDGGDCDDHDPTAYPLSPQRDCLGWRSERQPHVPELMQVVAGKKAPRLVLLLTIDAFRCGFEVGDSDVLRAACPNLTRLAHEGWARLDARTSVPNTSSSLTILMTGNPQADPLDHRRGRPTLPQRFRESGYWTEVLVSFPLILKDAALRAAFDETSYEFASEANSPFRGDSISARVLDRARALLDHPDQRAFLWVHYPDPHFPFMIDDSPLKHTSIEDYAKVIERTDAAIGVLLAELSKHSKASEVLVLVTADHGEEFGEHGERYHGFTLYEEGVRIPIIAWSPLDHRRFVHSVPPGSNAEIGDYLLQALGDSQPPAPTPATDVLLRTVTADRQYGVVSGGWKLIYNSVRNTKYLFNLNRDPRERQNLAEAEPAMIADLGRKLGTLLSPLPYGSGRQGRAASP